MPPIIVALMLGRSALTMYMYTQLGNYNFGRLRWIH